MAGLGTVLAGGSGDWETDVWPGRLDRRNREGTERGGAVREALGKASWKSSPLPASLSTRSWASVVFCFNSKVDIPHTGIRATLFLCLHVDMPFPGGSVVKTPPAMQETQVRSLGWEDPLEKEMATHSSILTWESHRQKSLVGSSPWGCIVGHD